MAWRTNLSSFRLGAIALAATGLLPGGMLAYPTDVHEQMSRAAYEKSLGSISSDVISRLDITSTDMFDSGDAVASAAGLVRFGSVFEDGIVPPRVVNHFFDPQNFGRGLTAVPLTVSSPTWILDEHQLLDNQYSYSAARRYLFDALTAQHRPDRDHRLGQMFQSLGHVIHHIQDMAQPQHTRNDDHLPIGSSRSLYELYSSDQLRRFENEEFDDEYIVGLANPHGYVFFETPLEYWSRQAPGCLTRSCSENNIGMADFSSRYFVSEDTNFGLGSVAEHPDYLEPALSGTSPVDEDAITLGIGSVVGRMHFRRKVFTDEYNSGTVENRRLTTYSIFSPHFTEEFFYLNGYNFEEYLRILVPRAIAFSSGFLNFFFRAKISFEQQGSEWIIRNLGEEQIAGTFHLYYDSVSGRHPVPNATWENLTVNPNSTFAIGGWQRPADANGEYLLVYRGRVGKEGDVDCVSRQSLCAVAWDYLQYTPTPVSFAFGDNRGCYPSGCDLDNDDGFTFYFDGVEIGETVPGEITSRASIANAQPGTEHTISIQWSSTSTINNVGTFYVALPQNISSVSAASTYGLVLAPFGVLGWDIMIERSDYDSKSRSVTFENASPLGCVWEFYVDGISYGTWSTGFESETIKLRQGYHQVDGELFVNTDPDGLCARFGISAAATSAPGTVGGILVGGLSIAEAPEVIQPNTIE